MSVLRVFLSLSGLFFGIVVFISLSYAQQNAEQVGSDISDNLRNFYMKDRNTMNDKLYTPGNDSSQSLTTINGEKGPGNFNCTSEFPFAEIIYYPSNSTGDINLVINEDLDLNGTYEYTVSLNGVSAICTTGVLVCSAGTTNNCNYYQIAVDSTGRVYFKSPISYSPIVSACYFINATAGNISIDFPNGVSKVLKDVSGLVSNLISNARDFVGVVSYKDYQNFTVKLSGTRPSSCVSANSDTLNRAKSYYSSGGRDDSVMQADIDAVKTGTGYDAPVDGMDSATALGVYEYASTSPSLNAQPPPNFYQCVIRNVVVNKVNKFYENCSPISWQGQQWCIVDDKSSGGCISGGISLSTPINVVLKPTQSLVAIFYGSYSICDDDSTTGYLKYSGDFSGNYTYGCELKSGKVIYVASSVDKKKNVTVETFKQTHHGGGCDYYHLRLIKSYSYNKDVLIVQSSNNCPSDPSCTLKEEYVCEKNGTNCIQTYSSTGKAVNLTPMCYSFSTQLDNYIVCSDGSSITVRSQDGTKTLISGNDKWFYIKRTYTCDNKTQDPNMPGKDFFDNAVKTRESIYTDNNKTNYNYDSTSGNYTYKDFISSQGNVQTGTLTTINKSCNKVCRVKVKASLKGNYSAGTGEAAPNIDPNNTSPIDAKDTLDYVEVRECVNDVCQYDTASEELLADCFCLETDDRMDTETLSGIMSTYEASKDMICSSSPP